MEIRLGKRSVDICVSGGQFSLMCIKSQQQREKEPGDDNITKPQESKIDLPGVLAWC